MIAFIIGALAAYLTLHAIIGMADGALEYLAVIVLAYPCGLILSLLSAVLTGMVVVALTTLFAVVCTIPVVLWVGFEVLRGAYKTHKWRKTHRL